MAKILENMEIGHNVMHGQWDWMNDPVINSSVWDWDTASTKEAWKHSHNFIHHTFTNILGKDRDLGYEIMRIDPHQKWHPFYLLQPFYNILLMMTFEWGVALHDLDFTAIRAGEKDMKQVAKELKGIAGKARTQITKDYIAWPLISGGVMTLIELGLIAAKARRSAGSKGSRAVAKIAVRGLRSKRRVRREVLRQLIERRSFREPFRRTLTANVVANIIRNVWSYAIIFCGHFPDQTYTFTEQEAEDETRGGWYVRQLTGAANIDGSPLFHVISGNLGYQVEHHLYPDMPSTRYGEIAPKVREICERYDLPYNTGSVLQAAGHGAALDHPPGAAGRQAASEAGALPRPAHPGQGRARSGDAGVGVLLACVRGGALQRAAPHNVKTSLQGLLLRRGEQYVLSRGVEEADLGGCQRHGDVRRAARRSAPPGGRRRLRLHADRSGDAVRGWPAGCSGDAGPGARAPARLRARGGR